VLVTFYLFYIFVNFITPDSKDDEVKRLQYLRPSLF